MVAKKAMSISLTSEDRAGVLKGKETAGSVAIVGSLIATFYSAKFSTYVRSSGSTFTLSPLFLQKATSRV
jgi:hypothetical protein